MRRLTKSLFLWLFSFQWLNFMKSVGESSPLACPPAWVPALLTCSLLSYRRGVQLHPMFSCALEASEIHVVYWKNRHSNSHHRANDYSHKWSIIVSTFFIPLILHISNPLMLLHIWKTWHRKIIQRCNPINLRIMKTCTSNECRRQTQDWTKK